VTNLKVAAYAVLAVGAMSMEQGVDLSDVQAEQHVAGIEKQSQ